MAQTNFQNDKTKDEWKLLKDVGEVEILPVSKLEPFFFFKKREVQISSKALFTRANKNKANLGQLQAEDLLKHQKDIPKEWRQFYLIFPGTVWCVYEWRNLDNRYIPYLRWDSNWTLRFCGLCAASAAFESDARLLRPRK